MAKKFRTKIRRPRSDNPKSKIQNPKCLGLVAFVLALVLCGPAAEAQQQAKIPKIGWLGTGGSGFRRELIIRVLRDLGYVEGKNLAFEYRSAEGKLDRLPTLAAELVRLKVDLIFAGNTNSALAAKNASRTIPVVFLVSGDPAAAGLVDSLARPGGNLTGFTTIGEVLAGKKLELLKETVPKLSRVAVLWNPRNPASAQQWKESQLPARALGLQLHSMEVSGADKFDNAFKEAMKARSAALAVTENTLFSINQKRIVELAAKNHMPAIYARPDFVESGGLMSYGADEVESHRRVAYYIDRILKGSNPSDLPVEQPTKFELAMNFKTAKALGLTIPPIVLMRVTKVVK